MASGESDPETRMTGEGLEHSLFTIASSLGPHHVVDDEIGTRLLQLLNSIATSVTRRRPVLLQRQNVIAAATDRLGDPGLRSHCIDGLGGSYAALVPPVDR